MAARNGCAARAREIGKLSDGHHILRRGPADRQSIGAWPDGMRIGPAQIKMQTCRCSLRSPRRDQAGSRWPYRAWRSFASHSTLGEERSARRRIGNQPKEVLIRADLLVE